MKEFEVLAPGRAEVLGNHTDYNEGLVLSIAINVGTRIVGSAREDESLLFHSEGLKESWQGSLSEMRPLKEPEATWPNYILGMAQGFRDLGHAKHGVEFRVSTTIPIGAGLSSSAALEMASGLAFQNVYGVTVDSLELAKMGQKAEHTYAGVKCGLLDQISVLMGKDKHLTFIDCRSLEVRHLSFPEGWTFVIIHSGVNHALTGGEYNERREACEEAAKILGCANLRDVTPGELDERKAELPDLVYRRAMHPVGETARVAQSVSCLATGNIEGLGKLMFDSHQSSIDYFENSCEELDFLVEQARQQPQCIGARLSGGGFGGATINLVREDEAAEFAEVMQKRYQEHYGKKPLVLVSPPSMGAHLEDEPSLTTLSR
ncbi:MAG: galactokinase [Verrucomicrobiota bacterium]